MISNWGRLYDRKLNVYIPRELIKSTNFEYVKVCTKSIDNKDIFIKMHTLIGYVYIGVPAFYNTKTFVINHIDGVKWHNEPYNLEWVSQSENINHADKNNLIARPYGEDNSQAVLTDEIYKEICRLTQEGYYPNQINKILNCGIDITNIAQKIRKGTSELLISKDYDFSNIPMHNYDKYADNDVKFICSKLEKGLDEDSILLLLGIDVNTLTRESRYLHRKRIRDIKNRKSFINISMNYNF